MPTRIAIIGGDAAGMSAASRARRQDPTSEITVFEQAGVASYGACGMPYHLDGRIPDPTTLIVRTPAEFAQANIDLQLHSRVVEINTASQYVDVQSTCEKSARPTKHHFDKLLIATGAEAVQPRIAGCDRQNVFLFKTFADMLRIEKYLQKSIVRNVTIVGAGYLGIELAEVLTLRGLQTRLLDLAGTVMSKSLDHDISQLVLQELNSHGVLSILGESLLALNGPSNLVREVVTSHGQWETDLVVIVMGVRPASDLAKRADLALDKFGAIQVNSRQETTQANIWAAGDCTSAMHRISGTPTWIPLGPQANKQGRIAGANMVGQSLEFPGILGTAFVKAFDLHIGRTGLNEAEASAAGLEFTSKTITASDRAPYYPGGGPTTIRLIAEKSTGKLIGGQVIGRAGVPGRTNVIATAMHSHMTVSDLSELDLGYAPPFAPVWDPLIVAANQF